MTRGRGGRGAAALAAVVFCAGAARAETAGEEIDRCLAGLAAEDPAERERAGRLLDEIGPEALDRYSPARQGRDPDVRDAVRERMDRWGYVAPADLGIAPRAAWRLAPWERVEDVPPEHRTGLDDDRLRPYLLSVLDADANARAVLIYRQDWPVDPALVRAVLALAPEAVARGLARRAEVSPDILALPELSAALAPLLHSPREAGAAATVLARAGRESALLAAALRDRRIHPQAVAGFPSGHPGRDAVLDAAEAGWGRDAAALAIDAPRYLDLRIAAGDVGRIALLPAPHAVPALRLLLSRDAGVRFRAAALLADLGEPSGGLGDFDSRAVGFGGLLDDRWPLEAVRRQVAALGGDRVEIRLRKLAESGPPRTDLVLDALARRGRAQDVTFVYAIVKRAPSPEGVLAVARLGSAAAVPLLFPDLGSPDPAKRIAAINALRQIRGSDGDYDPRGPLAARGRAARAWRRWWDDNKSSFRPAVR